MFLGGPFLSVPFLGTAGVTPSFMLSVSNSSSVFIGTTAWDALLANPHIRLVYLAQLEPLALTDRS